MDRLIAVHDIATLSESERELLDEQLNDVKQPLQGVELAVYELEDGGSSTRCVAARSSKVEVGASVAARTWAAVRQRQSVEGDEHRFTSLNFADELVPIPDD